MTCSGSIKSDINFGGRDEVAEEMVQLLVDKHADLSITGRGGRTVLHQAALRSRYGSVY